MDSTTGKLYESKEAAEADGVDPDRLLLIQGLRGDVLSVSAAVKAARRAEQRKARRKKGKTARAARKTNRG